MKKVEVEAEVEAYARLVRWRPNVACSAQWNSNGTSKKNLEHPEAQSEFPEAVESFLDPHGIQVVDSKHSGQEKRLYWAGRISTGRVLTTRFTKRGSKIRLIGSAE